MYYYNIKPSFRYVNHKMHGSLKLEISILGVDLNSIRKCFFMLMLFK